MTVEFGEGRKDAGRLVGISAAMATAFDGAGCVDYARMTAHARSCLDQGCDSVTVCGTTGEGASLDQQERHELHATLVKEGVPPRKIVVALYATAVREACRQAEQADEIGASALLVPPPFYFKDVGEAAVFAWYDAFLGRIAGLNIPVLLYHIPQVTAVTITADLAARLKQAHPKTVLGVKDSGGIWASSLAFLERRELAVFIGDERFLARAVRLGAKGSISGLANLRADRLVRMLATGEEDEAVTGIVDTLVAGPVVPAVKYLLAKKAGAEGWRTVRPPLQALSRDDMARLDGLFEKWMAIA